MQLRGKDELEVALDIIEDCDDAELQAWAWGILEPLMSTMRYAPDPHGRFRPLRLKASRSSAWVGTIRSSMTRISNGNRFVVSESSSARYGLMWSDSGNG